MMYGNYGFNIPEPYEGTPCGSSVTIATRAKWGLNSIKTAVPMYLIFGAPVTIPLVLIGVPLLSKVVLKDASYKERLLKGNAVLLALLAVAESMKADKGFKRTCAYKARHPERFTSTGARR